MLTPRTHLDIVLLFDTEDTFSPPEVGNDDSIKELADILTAAELPGVFLFIGDRAQQLGERNRPDILDSLRPHEVGLHTRSGLHPTGPEYVTNKSWDDGLAESLRHEREGVEIIERVFGRRCCALSTHWLFATPHALRSAAILDLPYVYAFPSAPPLHSLSRYAGALCLPWWSPTHDDKPFLPYIDGFDEHYHDPRELDSFIEGFSQQIDRCLAAGHPFMSALLYHPQRVRLAEFIDTFITPNGHNVPPGQYGRRGSPKRYTPEQVRANLDGFRRLVKWIKHDPRLRPITMAELVRRYGGQPAEITPHELADAAAEIVRNQSILPHPRFSPAEITVALAEALLAHAEGRAGEPGVRHEVLGPTRNPVVLPELPSRTWDELLHDARFVTRHVAQTGHLPHGLGDAPLTRIGINHLYDAFAQALHVIRTTGRPPAVVPLRRMPRYPDLAPKIAQRYLEIADHANVDPDLNIDASYRHAKLQTWTLKPAALPSPPPT